MRQSIFSIYILIIAGLFFILSGCGGGGVSSTAIGGYSTISSGSVTLSWEAPTNNSDGSSLTDLAGYKVYYGSRSGNYTETVDVGNFSSATINSLASGTWCFTVSAYDVSGNESSLADEACTTLT